VAHSSCCSDTYQHEDHVVVAVACQGMVFGYNVCQPKVEASLPHGHNVLPRSQLVAVDDNDADSTHVHGAVPVSPEGSDNGYNARHQHMPASLYIKIKPLVRSQ